MSYHKEIEMTKYRNFYNRLFVLVYIGSVCQTATITELDAPSIVPGQWVTVQFEFYSCPEYVRVGTPLIFRESKTKGMGEVVHIFGFDLAN